MQIGLTVGDSIDRLADSSARFAFAELTIGDGSLPPDEVDPDRLDDALAGRDLCVHLPFEQELVTDAAEVNDAIVAYQRRLLDAASDLGADKAVLHGTSVDRDDLALRDAFVDQLDRVVTAGEDAGVEVVVENVGHHHHGVQLSVLGEAAEAVDAAVCFDVGHAYMEGGNDAVKRFVKRYGDRISHLHLHDARRRGDTHIPMGAGEIDYAPLAEYLGEFDGTAALEVFTDDPELLADSAARTAALFDAEF